MLEFFIGEYKKQDCDIILDKYHPVYPCALNKDNTFILFDDERLDSEAIDFMKNSKLKFKIVAKDREMIKGRRNAKTLTITGDKQLKFSPFELAFDIMTCRDRNFLFGFLMEHKPELFVVLKYLSCNTEKFSESNKKAIAWWDVHQFRINKEIIYGFISFYIKPETTISKFSMKWKYPKKEESEDNSQK